MHRRKLQKVSVWDFFLTMTQLLSAAVAVAAALRDRNASAVLLLAPWYLWSLCLIHPRQLTSFAAAGRRFWNGEIQRDSGGGLDKGTQ